MVDVTMDVAQETAEVEPPRAVRTSVFNSTRLRTNLTSAVALVTVFFSSFALYASNLAFRSFWRDEGTTMVVVSHGWRSLVSRISEQEFVMGLYYVGLKVWVSALGPGPRTVRAFSAGFGALTIVAAVAFLTRNVSRYAAALGVVLLVSNVALYSTAREARTYAVTGAFATIAALAAVEATTDRWSPWWAALAMSAVIYSHPLSAVAVAGQLVGCFVLAAPGPTRRTLVRIAQRSMLLCVPLAILVLRARANGSALDPGWWITKPSAKALKTDLQWNIGGLSEPLTLCILAFVAVGAAALWRGIGPVARNRPILGLLLGWAFGPTVALLAVTYLAKPMFLSRYVYSSVPAFAILAAYGLASVRKRLLSASIVGVMILLSYSANGGAPRWQSREDWQAAYNVIPRVVNTTEPIMVQAGYDPVWYYNGLNSPKYRRRLVGPTLVTATDTRVYRALGAIDPVKSVDALASRSFWMIGWTNPADLVNDLEPELALRYRADFEQTYSDVRLRHFVPVPVPVPVAVKLGAQPSNDGLVSSREPNP